MESEIRGKTGAPGGATGPFPAGGWRGRRPHRDRAGARGAAPGRPRPGASEGGAGEAGSSRRAPASRRGRPLLPPAVTLLLLLAFVALHPSAAAAFQPNTLRIGILEIHPSFQTETTYNTNINLTKDAVSDVIFKQSPAVSLDWGRNQVPVRTPRLGSRYGLPIDLLLDYYLLRVRPMGESGYEGRKKPKPSPGRPMESAVLGSLRFRRFSFRLKYAPEIIRLLDHSEFDCTDHEVTFAGDLRLPGGFYLRVDDLFLKSSAINSFRNEVADFNTILRTQGIGFYTNQASLTVGYNVYADYAAFVTYSNYLFYLQDVDAEQLLLGPEIPDFLDLELVGIDSDTLGFGIQTVGIYLAKPLWRNSVLTLGYLFGRVDGNLHDFALKGSLVGDLLPVTARVTDDPRDAVYHEVRCRFQRVLTARQRFFGMPVPKTSMEFSFGYQWRDFDETEITVEIPDRPPLVLPIQLKSFSEFLVELRFQSRIRPKTEVSLLLSRYPKEEVGGTGKVSINYKVAFAVTQQVLRKWHLGARGVYRRRESPFENAIEDYSNNYEADAKVSYHLQSWLQGSIIYQFLARDGQLGYNDFQAHRIRLQVRLAF